MLWPQELITALERGMDVTPVAGLTPEQVYRELLDEAARRAVWRARGKAELLGAALRTPYTPIGSITMEGVNRLAVRLCLHGPEWSDAVELIHDFMEKHAEEICRSFKDEARPYHDGISFEDAR